MNGFYHLSKNCLRRQVVKKNLSSLKSIQPGDLIEWSGCYYKCSGSRKEEVMSIIPKIGIVTDVTKKSVFIIDDGEQFEILKGNLNAAVVTSVSLVSKLESKT